MSALQVGGLLSALLAFLWGLGLWLLFRGQEPAARSAQEDPNFYENEVFNLYNTDREMAMARVQSGQMDLSDFLENQWRYENE